MEEINRQNILKEGSKISAAAFIGAKSPEFFDPLHEPVRSGTSSAIIPLPIQVVVDDVGWWSGRDGSKNHEPYRSGIQRNHVPADYQAIVALGEALGIRPQAAMVLCEWDKDNVLGKLPSVTWMGENWDNSKWIGPWMEEAADIIRNNRRHYEITLHGVGHEYWTDGKFSRAEWADTNGVMRPPQEIEKRLDLFEKIMSQHQLGPFPTSFVPAAFNHGFGPTGTWNTSIAEILDKHGIRYVNTPFHRMYNAAAAEHRYFGFNSGVLTIDRGKDLLDWNAIGVGPGGQINGPTCGMHWANLIHPDPARNSEIVGEWVELLISYQEREDTMLPPDSRYFQSQLLYHALTKITSTENSILLDFKALKNLPADKVKDEFTLKVKSESALKFKYKGMKGRFSVLEKRSGDFLYTMALKRSKKINQAAVNLVIDP